MCCTDTEPSFLQITSSRKSRQVFPNVEVLQRHACLCLSAVVSVCPPPPWQVKVFQLSSGFCYVTFSEHTAPVTAVSFLPSGAAVLSASLDGSVRAYDLLRYR